MKYLILILAVTLTACGGGSSVVTQANPFQEALGKSLPTQPTTPTPSDPFAPLVKKNGG
jgi:hypothetical protein